VTREISTRSFHIKPHRGVFFDAIYRHGRAENELIFELSLRRSNWTYRRMGPAVRIPSAPATSQCEPPLFGFASGLGPRTSRERPRGEISMGSLARETKRFPGIPWLKLAGAGSNEKPANRRSTFLPRGMAKGGAGAARKKLTRLGCLRLPCRHPLSARRPLWLAHRPSNSRRKKHGISA
jgi:hypothetical protein